MLVPLVFLVGFTYGGVFTTITGFMKQICHPTKVGTLLGAALVLMATGGYFFANTLGKGFAVKFQGKDIGPSIRHYFFVFGSFFNFLCITISFYLFQHQRRELEEEARRVKDNSIEMTDDLRRPLKN